jgi:hypothetical protein
MQAQALANAQTQANLERINFETCLALDRLSSTILKKETLFTESSIGGYVKIENLPTPKESNVICVKIETGSEKHEFIFNHDSIRNKK